MLCKDDLNAHLHFALDDIVLERRAPISLISIQLQQTAGTQCLLDKHPIEFTLASVIRLEVAQETYGY